MKKKDILTIATAALGTATLTVTAFWAGPLDAGHDAEAPAPLAAKTRLVAHGVEIGLAASGGRIFQAGEQPEFELTATNTTNQTANVSVCVTMTASSLADALSRTVRLPAVMWWQEQIVSLGPNETKTLTLATRTNLPAKSVISVSLHDLDQKAPTPLAAIVALSFATTTNGASPFVASAR